MKSHTFNGVKYAVEFVSRIDGICETPGETAQPRLTILEGDDFRAFHSAFHESGHAAGVPDEYLHDRDGNAATEEWARFVWRWVQERKK